jgi:hypothetical protein
MRRNALLLCILGALVLLLVEEDRGLISPAIAQPLANVTAFTQNFEIVEVGELTRQPRAIALCDDEDDMAEIYRVELVPWQDEDADPVPWLMVEGAVYPVSPKEIGAGTTAPCIIAAY